MPQADPADAPREFAALVTGDDIEAVDAALLTDAMAAVYHATNLPSGYNRGAVADGMRGLVAAADLRISGFGEAAQRAARRVTSDLAADPSAVPAYGPGGEPPEPMPPDVAPDREAVAALPDDRPTDLPVSGDDVITVAFDVTVEDVSEMLNESGELVTVQRDQVEALEAGDRGQGQDEGVGR